MRQLLDIGREAAWTPEDIGLGRRWLLAFGAIHRYAGLTWWGGVLLPHTIRLERLTFTC